LQPMGTQFHYDDILNWTPESDVDARYNISHVPLQKRRTGHVVNQYANPNAKMILVADSYPIGGDYTYSYGTEGEWRRYAVTFWQYIDVFNFWGGPINIPTPEIVDAAHKNGVPVVGTVFFENRNIPNEQRRIYYNQGTPENPKYPYADKLWELAEFYGFDGWFFNFESTGTSSHANEIRDFLLYMQETKPNPDMILVMYDSPATGGFLSRLTNTNRILLQTNDGRRTADYYFGDYKWTSRSFPEQTLQTCLNSSPPIDPYRVTSSWPIHMNGYLTIGPGGTTDQLNGLMTQAPWVRHTEETADWVGDSSLVNKAINSLGLFGGHSTINLSSSASDFLNVHDPRLWVGYEGLALGNGPLRDPSEGYLGVGNGGVIDGVVIDNSKPETAEAWYGFSQFLADKTVILDFPFATNFNPGIGDMFFVEGKPVKGAWTNRGIQDILPTWRWTVRTSEGPKVTPSFDLTTAWYGGASLKLEGEVTSPNEVRLYSTFLDFDANTDYELTYVAKGSPIKFGFYTSEDYSEYIVPSEPAINMGTKNGWTSYRQDLSELKGKTVYGICIITYTGTVNANIGEIVIDKTNKGTRLPAPQNLTLDGYLVRDSENSEARIYWDHVESDQIVKYEIYQVYANGTRRFLNATHSNAFFVSNINRDPDSPLVTLEVVALDESLRKGGSASISFHFGMSEGEAIIVPKPDNPNLVLDPDGTRFEYIISKENASEPGKALFDGDRVQSKWCVVGLSSLTDIRWRNYNGHYVVIDMGRPVTISRWVTVNAGPVETPDFNTHTFSLAYIPVQYGDERDLHFEWEPGVLHTGSPNQNPPTATENKFNLIRGTADGTSTPGPGGANFYTRGNWVVADRVVNNPRNEAGNIVDRDFPDGPVTARYWMFLVEQAMGTTSNGALRVFELELYEKPKAIMPSTSINTNQVKVIRSETSDSVYFKNIPYAPGTTRVNVYDSLDADTPIATAVRQSDGTAVITGFNLKEEGGRLYYDIQFEGYALSDRLSVAYDPKKPVVSRIPEISLNTARFGIDYNSVIPVITGSLGYPGSPYVVTKYNSFFGALTAKLPEGSVLYLYDNEDDIFPSRISAPVANGATTTSIEAIEFSKSGGYVWVSVKEPGKAESQKIRLYYTGDEEIDYTASLQYALNTAPALNQDDYIAYTWQNYVAAKAAAENSLGQSASAIVQAWNNWLEAIDNLITADQIDKVVMSLDKDKLHRTERGQLSVKIMLKNGDELEPEQADAVVEFFSNNPTIVSVDDSGRITANKVGSAEVSATVTINGVIYETNTIEITVEEMVMEGVEGLEISYNPVIVEVGEEVEVTITAKQVTNLAGMDISFTYDKDMLELSEIIFNDSFGYKEIVDEENSVRLLATVVGSDTALTGDVELVKIKFKAKDVDGLTSVSITEGATLSDDQGALYTQEESVDGQLPIADSDVTGGGMAINDVVLVAKAFGLAEGDEGYDPKLDMNKDGVIDIIDIAYVAARVLMR